MTTNIYFKTAATIGLLSTNLFAGTIGDRSPETHCRFPDRVMMDKEQGGRIMDITKPPFNAKGDGKTDDTAALIAAYDFCLAKADEAAQINTPKCRHPTYGRMNWQKWKH